MNTQELILAIIMSVCVTVVALPIIFNQEEDDNT